MTGGTHRIGLISDTHGMVRASVHGALAGVEMILHAGDVGSAEILDKLALIAPVHAVLGNTDHMGRLRGVPQELEQVIGGVSIHVSHGHELGSPTPQKLLERYPHDVLVYGHTHRQLVTRAGDRLVVNPGAAGARRFDLVPSLGILTIAGGRAEVELVELGD